MSDLIEVETICGICEGTKLYEGRGCYACVDGCKECHLLAPDSLATLKMKLADMALKKGMYMSAPERDLPPECKEWNKLIAAIRNHPDYKGR